MVDWWATLTAAKRFFFRENPEGKKVEDIDIKSFVKPLSSTLRLWTTKFNKKEMKNCFVGQSAVDWMIANLNIQNRKVGVELGKKLIDQEYIHNISGAHDFSDSPTAYFQFLKTDS